MEIKKVTNKRPSLIILGIIFLSLLTFAFMFKESGSVGVGSANSSHDIQMPTTVLSAYNISDMIKKDINKVYSDSVFSIYFNSSFGVPKLYYVYRDSLDYRQLTDKFFVHVYPKNGEELKKLQKYDFVNLDFIDPNPVEFEIGGEKYFVFKRSFSHPTLSSFIEIDNIKSLNTGRHASGKGRSHEATGIVLSGLKPMDISNNLEKLTIILSRDNFNKIKERRNEALKSRVLTKKEDDFVKTMISHNNLEKLKGQLRLKGDWTDHLNDPKKWSFRVLLENDETIIGVRKFSVQHPKVRNYEWEWLIHKVMKKNDIIGLRYNFMNVDLLIEEKNGKSSTTSLGIMAIEESFDKRLIENNRRREGVILSFEESQIWDDRKKQFDLKLEENSRNENLQSILNAPIKLFEESKVLSDPKLSKQFNLAKNLLQGLRNKELKISEVFDIDKLTTFVALSNLFGAQHGLISHNLKFYFNPITNKLEPICFDAYAGTKIRQFIHYPFSDGDEVYTQKLMEKLETVCTSQYIERLVEAFDDELNDLFANLSTELKTTVDPSILDYNSNFIKKQIYPSDIIVSNLSQFNSSSIDINIANLSTFPVVIQGIEHIDGKNLSNPFSTNPIIHPNEKKIINFDLKSSFQNAFVSKKNKVGGFRYPKDIKKLKIRHALLGGSINRKGGIIPFGNNKASSAQNINDYKRSFDQNYSEFEFIKFVDGQKKVIIPKGDYQIDKTIRMPKNHEVVIEEGVSLDLVDGASFISYSPVTCKGTEEYPIRFYSSDGTGDGFFVSNAEGTSVLEYCFFSNLSNPASDIWELSGSVNFHETYVEIRNSSFEKNRCEDALNIIRSNFLIDGAHFENTFSDAFDGDFVEGKILNSTFLNCGNDGIDVSGSNIYLNNITITNSSDKGISAGESSVINGSNIKVHEGEIGVVSKDLSTISLSNVNISNTRLGLSSFQKKSEYGAGLIKIKELTLLDNELNYLIEQGSHLTVDDMPVETTSSKVIDQMYGKEYGKSSK